MIGEVVPFRFEQEQKIGEATKVYRKKTSLTCLDIGGCELDYLSQGMG